MSVIVNIFSYLLQKQGNTISNKQAFFFLLYDTLKLCFLLFLSGGILNPFCILIIAPVIISASYLPAFWTISLSIYSIILILIINFNYVPLDWEENLLDYRSNINFVSTASQWQGRQPIYSSSLNRWENYSEFLSPLKSILRKSNQFNE